MLSSLITRIRHRLFGNKRVSTIDPDEVFLDASNLPGFDTSQFEGRIEKPIGKKTFGVLACVLLLFGVIVLGRLFVLQIQNGEVLAKESEENRLQHSTIFAERGVIYDRNGVELAWNVPGEDKDFPSREYIGQSGFAHLLGYIQTPLKDKKGYYYQTKATGLFGVERSFDETLQGENGLKIVETDVFGEVRSESVLTPPEDGRNFILSVDKEVQHALHGFIRDLARRIPFEGGAGAIMNVETGEILAITSYPEYNSNILSGRGDSTLVASYVEDERKPFLNRVVSGLYTPGSIVKPFLALGALEEGIIDEHTTILSTGSIRIPHPYVSGEYSIFRDWKAHGEVAMREAIAVSSNVYFFEIGGGLSAEAAGQAGVREREGLGIERIEKYLRYFGLGEESGINLSSEERGVVPNPQWKEENFEDGTWRVGDTYNTSIGQYGFQITPIQAMRAVSAIANDGTLITPTVVLNGATRKEKIPVSNEHFSVVKDGMRLAVTNGTASGLNIPGIPIAAKTGTAEIGTQKKFVNSWAIGYFPYEEPKYAFVVIMEKGPSENLIGSVYVMRQLLEWMNNNTPEYLE